MFSWKLFNTEAFYRSLIVKSREYELLNVTLVSSGSNVEYQYLVLAIPMGDIYDILAALTLKRDPRCNGSF